MDYFEYKNNQLYVEDLPVSTIAKQYGTPCYIYSHKTIARHFNAFNNALSEHPHLICYAVKANSNIAILQLLAKLGSGFDVVSKGELQRALYAGAKAQNIVFSGVGKTTAEIQYALDQNIHCLNVESEAELNRIQSLCQQQNRVAPISLRINPDINPQTHPYISTGLKDNKFGIAMDKAIEIYHRHADYPNLKFIGIDCHIGSQLTQLAPFLEALDKLIQLADLLASQDGLKIEHLDLGGGLGVIYKDENPPTPSMLAQQVKQKLADRPYKVILEPGRAIMANAGILVTQVEYIKKHHQKQFAIVDAAMNDLLRPALYQAWHEIIPVMQSPSISAANYDIVGGVCESGDFFGHNRKLAINESSLLAIRGAGAYGATMSSNYNTRPKPAEILVSGETPYLIRQRETFNDMIQNEQLLKLHDNLSS